MAPLKNLVKNLVKIRSRVGNNLNSFHLNKQELISLASNLSSFEDNPPFEVRDFLEMYPYFNNRVCYELLNYYVKLANSSLSYSKWGEAWKLGMCLFIAHYLTLYIMATDNLTPDSPAASIIGKSIAQGQVASKSAGSLSKSYSYNSVDDDLNGWAAWKLTLFGQQFASMAKLIGKGGSYIW